MDQLPVDCICHILAFTSPRDVCRLAGVSSAFRSAAGSDLLWKSFLPEYYREIIAQSSSSSFLNCLPEKELYFQLSDHPILIGNGNSSFALEKESGDGCYTTVGLKSKQDPLSRFSLRIDGKMETRKLTPRTYYAVYLVFKCRNEDYSQSFESIISCIYSEGARVEKWTEVRFQDFSIESRGDGWMEIEIGQIFFEGENESTIFVSISLHTLPRDELVFKGIRVRQKSFHDVI